MQPTPAPAAVFLRRSSTAAAAVAGYADPIRLCIAPGGDRACDDRDSIVFEGDAARALQLHSHTVYKQLRRADVQPSSDGGSRVRILTYTHNQVPLPLTLLYTLVCFPYQQLEVSLLPLALVAFAHLRCTDVLLVQVRMQLRHVLFGLHGLLHNGVEMASPPAELYAPVMTRLVKLHGHQRASKRVRAETAPFIELAATALYSSTDLLKSLRAMPAQDTRGVVPAVCAAATRMRCTCVATTQQRAVSPDARKRLTNRFTHLLPLMSCLQRFRCVVPASDVMLQLVTKHCGRTLQSLRLHDCAAVTAGDIAAIAARCAATLQTLALGNYRVRGDELRDLAARSAKLRKLLLQPSCSGVTDAVVTAIACARPQLTHLALGGPLLTDTGLSAVAEHCLQLQALALDSAPCVSNRGLLQLGRACWALQRLDLYTCSCITCGVFADPQAWKSLRELSVRGCTELCPVNACLVPTLVVHRITAHLQRLLLWDVTEVELESCARSLRGIGLQQCRDCRIAFERAEPPC